MGNELESLTGKSGMDMTIMQVNCWHTSYESAWTMRELIKDLMLGYTGTTLGLNIKSTTHAGDREFYDGQRELHQHVARFQIWWES